MSLRATGSSKSPASSCFFITISRGDSIRSLALRPWHIYSAGFAALSVLGLGVAAGAFHYFRDDVVSALLTRQAEMQYAYEDRLSAMRGQIDRIASKQLLNQDTVEGRVHDLLSRQAQLETRASMIANLARLSGAAQSDVASPERRADAQTSRSLNPLLASPARPALPTGVSSFAPMEHGLASPVTGSDKPRPELPAATEALKSTLGPRADAVLNPDVPVPLRLEALSSSLEHMERTQIRAAKSLADATRSRTVRLRSAINEAGLGSDKLVPPAKGGVGGPFVPIKEDPSAGPFERQIVHLQNEAIAAERLERVLPFLPLRRPLAKRGDVTSGFGQRVDPFMGRMAMHTGLDLRDDYGSGVRVTAGGTVVIAGWSGGYGNMVEVEHVNGLSTRYAHLSQVLVTEGQVVKAGAIVGKLGSTGRSTGPHLHYEVRVDGEPVDPVRFLRAADKLAQDVR